VNLFLVIAIIFIIRKPVIRLIHFFIKKRFYRTIVSIFINLIWSFFIFWFIGTINPPFLLAILPFLVISISLNLSKIINNIISGAFLLGSGQFEVGDLVETNGIQGIIQEITLNYTVIKEFDGVDVIIPNSSVYGSSIIKFTHKKYQAYRRVKKEEFDKKELYKQYVKMINKLLSSNIKTTRYIKPLELSGSVNPETLNDKLMKVFDMYEPVFGIRPEYIIDKTQSGSVRIILYVNSIKPKLILEFIDSFLRDLVYEIYHEAIFNGWDKYQSIKNKLDGGVGK
ncbi:MAG: mechanosensitive ion channel family protein, partial [Candidatus Lokiarchaeota archaeon]|nr:mechanosensitive ion channel family protein [Candidatus Lokiarchaeota archaeon]